MTEKAVVQMQRNRGESQKKILLFIRKEIQEKGYPPSVREIADAVGLSSSSTVHGHLKRLEQKGLIRRNPMKPRAMELTGGSGDRSQEAVVSVPVIGKPIPHLPLMAEQNIEDYVPLPQALLGRLGEHFILRVQNEDLSGHGILRNDYLVVLRSGQPEAGKFLVVLRNEVPCVKTADTVDADADTMLGVVVSMFRLVE